MKTKFVGIYLFTRLQRAGAFWVLVKLFTLAMDGNYRYEEVDDVGQSYYYCFTWNVEEAAAEQSLHHMHLDDFGKRCGQPVSTSCKQNGTVSKLHFRTNKHRPPPYRYENSSYSSDTGSGTRPPNYRIM